MFATSTSEETTREWDGSMQNARQIPTTFVILNDEAATRPSTPFYFPIQSGSLDTEK